MLQHARALDLVPCDRMAARAEKVEKRPSCKTVRAVVAPIKPGEKASWALGRTTGACCSTPNPQHLKCCIGKQCKIRQSATVWLSSSCCARFCARSLDLPHLVRRAEILIVGRGYFSAASRNTNSENVFVSRVSPPRMPPIWTSRTQSREQTRRSLTCRSLMTGTVHIPCRLASLRDVTNCRLGPRLRSN